MIELEECPECGTHLSNDDLIEGFCPRCEFVFEEDTGDLLDDLDKEDAFKLGDVYDEDSLDE